MIVVKAEKVQKRLKKVMKTLKKIAVMESGKQGAMTDTAEELHYVKT